MTTIWTQTACVVQSKTLHATTDTPPTTPSAISTSAHQLVFQLRNILEELAGLETLMPGKKINGLLTDLVALCITRYSTEFTAYCLNIDSVPSLCEQLRPLCAMAEGELERHWARRILQEASSVTRVTHQTRDLLYSFPYYQNYLDLSRLEYSTLEAFLSPAPRNIVFVGSGPLPLTSLCILDRYPKVSVHNVDRDIEALQISQDLCKQLGYGDRMSFSCEDVSMNSSQTTSGVCEPNWKHFDVVFLAALVGMDTDAKLNILECLSKKLKPGTLVVARSARGLRTVLYPVLELSQDLQRIGLEVLAEVHPWTKVVNSIVVLRVMEKFDMN